MLVFSSGLPLSAYCLLSNKQAFFFPQPVLWSFPQNSEKHTPSPFLAARWEMGDKKNKQGGWLFREIIKIGLIRKPIVFWKTSFALQ